MSNLSNSWEKQKQEMAAIQKNINENIKLQKQQLYKMHPQLQKQLKEYK